MAKGATHNPDTKKDTTMMQAVFVIYISFCESGEKENSA
jgi:hypothetical protein